MSEQAVLMNTKSATRERKPGLGAALWANRWPYLFISPFYVLFAIFGLFPLVFSLILSLTEWKGVGTPRYIGLANFERMLNDQLFWQSFVNGVMLFFMYVPLMLILALVLAVLLNSQRIRGFRIFRTIIFLPFITNMVAAGFAFQIMLNKEHGLFNAILTGAGLPAVSWLETAAGARVSLCLLIIWAWLGYNMVIMLAGLQTIPADLSEAARVDGATSIQIFFRITIPLMRPVLTFCAILSTIGSFGLFTEVRTLTAGGPFNSTITPMIKIYGNAFGQSQIGYASALSYTFFVIIFAISLIQLRYFNQGTE